MISRNNGVFEVRGELTVTTVSSALQASQRLFSAEGDSAEGEWILDLSGVNSVDSAAVSLLLEWQRQALVRKRNFSAINMPDSLQGLLRVYDLQAIFNKE